MNADAEPDAPPPEDAAAAATPSAAEAVSYPPGIDPYSLTGQMQIHHRLVQYAGLVLIVLSLPLTWWSMTRYRVYEQRGVDLGSAEQTAAITKDMDERKLLEYNERVGSYGRAWALNLGRYEPFYYKHLGEKYATTLNQEIEYSRSSGTLGFNGFATWTGWFGVIFGIVLIASHVAPRFVKEMQPYAWALPWAGTALFGLFTLLTILFYFNVPDANGQGYSQGVGLGDYLAMLGGIIVTVGTSYEGMFAAARRLAELEEAEAVEEDEAEPEPETPPQKKKSRLEDW